MSTDATVRSRFQRELRQVFTRQLYKRERDGLIAPREGKRHPKHHCCWPGKTELGFTLAACQMSIHTLHCSTTQPTSVSAWTSLYKRPPPTASACLHVESSTHVVPGLSLPRRAGLLAIIAWPPTLLAGRPPCRCPHQPLTLPPAHRFGLPRSRRLRACHLTPRRPTTVGRVPLCFASIPLGVAIPHDSKHEEWREDAFCSQVAPHASSHACRHFHVPPDVGTARPCPPSTPAPPHPSTSLHVVASAASSRCRLECVQGSRSPAPGRPDPDGRGLNLVGDTISGSAASPSLHGSTPPHRSLLPLSSSPPVASSLRRRLQSSVILDLVTVVGSDPATLGRKKVPPSLSLEPRGLQRLARAEGACPMSDARPYN